MQKTAQKKRKLPQHCAGVALVLQGGGALGAYQGGVYQVLADHGYEPGWVAGISIGAINAAIIAGNQRDQRVEKLRAFWEKITDGRFQAPGFGGDFARSALNDVSAMSVMTHGVPGFFQPRIPPPWFRVPGTDGATSFYDTAPLEGTLLEVIDFEHLKAGSVRLSVGAVNVATGNSTYFDSHHHTIGPEHVMASAALPPGFPAIEIDKEFYWDGGVVSNTPLQYLLDERQHKNTLVFQVDLFSSRGAVPGSLPDVYERQKDIVYSSRTRFNTDRFREAQDLRRASARILEKLPKALRSDPDVKLVEASLSDATMSIVQLIYRNKGYESQSKDYEFSRASMEEHWQSGVDDTLRTLKHEKEWLKEPSRFDGVRTFDMTRDFD